MSISAYSAPTVAPPVLTSVSAILGSTSPVGGIVATAINVLQALGITVKGKTQHLSYDQVIPKAVDFSNSMVPIFTKAYGAGEILAIVSKVPNRFQKAMVERWGTDGLNGNIFQSVTVSPGRNDALSNQLGLFFLWVGTNIDAESTDEFRLVFDAYFAGIFLAAIADAGLSAGALKGTVVVPPPNTTTPATPSQPADGAQVTAGNSSLLMLIALAGAGWYMLKKGRK